MSRWPRTGAYSPDAGRAGRRALRNAALDLYAAGQCRQGWRWRRRNSRARGS